MAAQRKACVVFVHGLAKKPAPDKLHEIWLWGLERDNPMPSVFAPPNKGIRLGDEGVPSVFNYYADVFYGEDYATDTKSYYENNEDLEIATEGLNKVERELPVPIAQSPKESAFLDGFQAEIRGQLALLPSQAPSSPQRLTVDGEQLEIMSWLPDGVKEAVIKKAAMEAYYFLFDKEYERADGERFRVREELRKRLLAHLSESAKNADDLVVVSHSMGTMLAYDVLRNCPQCPAVSTLITIGSPLGVQEVQDELKAPGTKQVDFPAGKLGTWINIYDPLDPVCGSDPRFANDFAKVDGKSIVDVKESNWGSWRHTSTHYLAGSQFRKHLAQAIGLT